MDDRLVIRQATFEDAIILASTMRWDDINELNAAFGHQPLEALLIGLRSSAECWCATLHGTVMAMWGVVGQRGVGVNCSGVGWLLTSHLVDRRPLLFWKACKYELARLLDTWGSLTNWIDVRHERALRWSERLGFSLDAPAPWGKYGRSFQRFVVTKEDLNV